MVTFNCALPSDTFPWLSLVTVNCALPSDTCPWSLLSVLCSENIQILTMHSQLVIPRNHKYFLISMLYLHFTIISAILGFQATETQQHPKCLYSESKCLEQKTYNHRTPVLVSGASLAPKLFLQTRGEVKTQLTWLYWERDSQ